MTGVPFSGFLENLNGLRVVDDRSIQVIFNTPFAPFLEVMAGQRAPIVQEALIASGTADVAAAENDASQLIGSGPFVVTGHVPEQRLFLEWNGDYYKPDLPDVDNIEIFVIPDRNTRLAAFRAGRTDFFGLNFNDGLTLDEEREVVSNGNATLFDGPGQVSALWFDTQSPPFDNELIRRAVARAIDWEVLKAAMHAKPGMLQLPVPSLYFPQWASPEDIVLAYHPERAKQLLAEAGYPDGFETVILVPNTTEENLRAADVIAAFLAEMGIRVEIDVQEAATLRQRLSEALVTAACSSPSCPELPLISTPSSR